MYKRRRSDSPDASWPVVGLAGCAAHAALRVPSFTEQAVQFATRYLMAALGWVFFNFSDDVGLRYLTLTQLNGCLLVYVGLVSVLFLYAWRYPTRVWRFHASMWVDLLLATLALASDPYQITPSMLSFVAVALGNGMRYGMRMFAEAMLGSFACGAVALALRNITVSYSWSAGEFFLCILCIIIVIYAYMLMSRVERALQQSELASRTDPLTGLLNRRGLTQAASDWLAGAVQSGSPHRLAVMLADLDNFKSVNDRYGHAEGDRVLVQVATMLVQQTRSSDLVARYGGDEFVLLLTEAEATAAAGVALRVQEVIDEWMLSQNLSCGISIGVREVDRGELQLEGVLESVDRLLYAAKQQRAARAQQTAPLREAHHASGV